MKPRAKLKTVMVGLLKQGTSPERIALSVALGGVVGIIPLPGISTVVCVLLAIVLRLNHAVIQAANYAVYPFQILFLGGYILLGNQWFGGSASLASFDSLAVLMREDVWAGLLAMKRAGLHAVAVWVVTSPLPAVVLYYLSRAAAVRLQKALHSGKEAAVNPAIPPPAAEAPPVKTSTP
jgi:uncharacterized protein (DUF2062 family)